MFITFFSFCLPGSGCRLIKLLAKLHRSCWILTKSLQCFCLLFFGGVVFNLEINVGYRNFSLPFLLAFLSTQRDAPCEYILPRPVAFVLNHRHHVILQFPVLAFSASSVPDRDCETIVMLYIFLFPGSRDYVKTVKVCSRSGDCIFNFFICCEFP